MTTIQMAGILLGAGVVAIVAYALLVIAAICQHEGRKQGIVK